MLQFDPMRNVFVSNCLAKIWKLKCATILQNVLYGWNTFILHIEGKGWARIGCSEEYLGL
jgi:hypothetical protein